MLSKWYSLNLNELFPDIFHMRMYIMIQLGFEKFRLFIHVELIIVSMLYMYYDASIHIHHIMFLGN